MTPTDPHAPDGGDEPFSRSHVVFVTDPEGAARPVVVLNTDALPGHGERYLGVPLATADAVERATASASTRDAIAVHPSDWVVGGPEQTTYALPGDVRSVAHASVDRGIGALDSALVDAIAERVGAYLGLDP